MKITEQVEAPVPRLPAEARTRDGAVFDPRLDRWTFRTASGQISMNYTLVSGASRTLIISMKAVLLWYVENKSASHAKGMFGRLLHFFSTVKISDEHSIDCIDASTIINYRGRLTEKNSWYLSSLAGVIKKWAALGWPGVDAEAVKLLNEMRLTGNRKGEAVRTMDPVEGPLTSIERQALFDALKNAWSAGEIALEDKLLAWLALLLAPRPIQLSALKVRDLVCLTTVDGQRSFVLRVPRAKQREQFSRDRFTDRPIIGTIGELLSSHLDEIRAIFTGVLTYTADAPIFPGRKGAGEWLPGFEWHCTAEAIGVRVARILEGFAVHSERTGEALKITPTRLRRTLGTHAAMEGHGELVIAALLDHSDTQNAGIYVEATPEIVDRIDRAMAVHLAPLAQAFAGILARPPADPGNAENPILDPRYGDGLRPAGDCGKHGFCGFAAPIACYTCVHFTAWLDGPHEEILDRLLEERSELMESGSARIAAINDRTILAVAQVVVMCAENRNALAEAALG